MFACAISAWLKNGRPPPRLRHVTRRQPAVASLPDKLSVTEPGAHATHTDVDWALYSPATHAVQLTAPADANVSVVAPAAHAKHCDCPAWPWYCPATQSVHACVDAALERPAAQALHVVAPTLANVSVTDPGAHAVHADVDAGLYCPAAHAVQLTAPEPPTASVTEPAAHCAHADVAAALYCPAAHAVQLTAPVPASVSVTEPLPHTKQVGWAALPWYCPAAQSAHATVGCEL